GVVANSFISFFALRLCHANAGTAAAARSTRNPPSRPTRSIGVVPFLWSAPTRYCGGAVSTLIGANPVRVRAAEPFAAQDPSAAITTTAPRHERKLGVDPEETGQDTAARQAAAHIRHRIACLIVHGSPSRTPLRR